MDLTILRNSKKYPKGYEFCPDGIMAILDGIKGIPDWIIPISDGIKYRVDGIITKMTLILPENTPYKKRNLAAMSKVSFEDQLLIYFS